MRYEEMNTVLLHRFPVLKEGYERLVTSHRNINEDPGAHVVYGDLFCDHVIKLARHSDPKSNDLRSAAEFIEQMAASHDGEVRNLVEVSVLERLIDEKISVIIPFLGPHSAKLVKSIGTRLHLDNDWQRLAR